MSDIETKLSEDPEPAVGPYNGKNEPGKTKAAINATNWSLAMKIYHTAIPCFLAFLMYVLSPANERRYFCSTLANRLNKAPFLHPLQFLLLLLSWLSLRSVQP